MRKWFWTCLWTDSREIYQQKSKPAIPIQFRSNDMRFGCKLVASNVYAPVLFTMKIALHFIQFRTNLKRQSIFNTMIKFPYVSTILYEHPRFFLSICQMPPQRTMNNACQMQIGSISKSLNMFQITLQKTLFNVAECVWILLSRH